MNSQTLCRSKCITTPPNFEENWLKINAAHDKWDPIPKTTKHKVYQGRWWIINFQCYHYTVWKFKNFSDNNILREINFAAFRHYECQNGSQSGTKLKSSQKWFHEKNLGFINSINFHTVQGKVWKKKPGCLEDSWKNSPKNLLPIRNGFRVAN